MLVEASFAALVLLAWRKTRGRKGMTKERRDIYLAALEHIADPKALRELADGFDKDGLKIEATILRKRADLRDMPREKWENFRAICERAIRKPDVNPEALEEMAAGFEAMTANGTAMKLRRRAAERRMEILAQAEEEQRLRETQETTPPAPGHEAGEAGEIESPPTPKNSGIAEDKIATLEKKIANMSDPEATIEPKAEEVLQSASTP